MNGINLRDLVMAKYDQADEQGKDAIVKFISDTLNEACQTIRENYKDYNEGRTSNKNKI